MLGDFVLLSRRNNIESKVVKLMAQFICEWLSGSNRNANTDYLPERIDSLYGRSGRRCQRRCVGSGGWLSPGRPATGTLQERQRPNAPRRRSSADQ
jgi:hypothetical protein